jgi:hypothetical protein
MIPKNIEEKTLELLNNLQTDFDISFEIKDIDYCKVIQKGKTATIYYNPKIVNSESITHELLHIWLQRFYTDVGIYIFICTQEDKKLSKFLNKFLCDHIGNCCDHFKMYPKYLEMGYSPKEFLKNGLELKTAITDIKGIKLKSLGFYNSQSVNLFIGFLFSILADHIKENDYTEHHKCLIEKDSELYYIVYDFWNKWEVFDIEDIDPIYNSDLELTDSFIDGISDWAKNKTFI